ncbi:MAG: T9SS type A sorting domain-containing protein, partial [Dolichospermum sp.]
NVIPEIVKGISIGNNTVATLANNAATFSVWDSINIGNNARVITGDNILVQGVDTNTLGVFNGGTNAGVSGNMRKWFNSSVSAIEFPLVSNTGANRLLSMSYVSLPTTIGSLTASFIGTAPGNNGLPRFDSTATMEANRAAINGYWTLAGSNNTTVGVYNLSLTATGFAGINSYTQLMVIRRADAVSPWTFIGAHSMGTGSNAAPIANRTNANLYGQFGIGSDTAANPLPVELLYFTGKNNDNNALLNWATSTEVNNKGFFVERSFDGTTFETLGFVAGAGNTRSVKNYQYVDAGIFNTANLVYYRLNQVDFDGTQVYSNIVALNVADESTEEIKVYPNPYRETTGVYINALTSGMANVEVLDMQGRVMAKQLVNVVNGTQYVDLKSTAWMNIPVDSAP